MGHRKDSLNFYLWSYGHPTCSSIYITLSAKNNLKQRKIKKSRDVFSQTKKMSLMPQDHSSNLLSIRTEAVVVLGKNKVFKIKKEELTELSERERLSGQEVSKTNICATDNVPFLVFSCIGPSLKFSLLASDFHQVFATLGGAIFAEVL